MYDIVKLNGECFAGPNGYWQPSGYCFKDSRGYLAYKGNLLPYIPQGGKNALQSILDSGGFTSEDALIFLQPIKSYDLN